MEDVEERVKGTGAPLLLRVSLRAVLLRRHGTLHWTEHNPACRAAWLLLQRG